MSRYPACFDRLKQIRQGAFVPFTVLGDPSRENSLPLIEALIKGGADALELGFPFSDPLADGPTIQSAMARARAANVTPDDCFAMLEEIRQGNDVIPIGLLVYANLVHAYGLHRFYQRCYEAGVDSVLVADVPVTEVEPFRKVAMQTDIDPILLCPPNISEDTLKQISELGRGYTYLLSRSGVTGTQVAAGKPLEHLLAQLDKYKAPPPLLGFGIAHPEQVQNAVRSGARGVICGSAVIQRLEQGLEDLDAAARDLSQFVASMKAATDLV